jgi:hypothetical protein
VGGRTPNSGFRGTGAEFEEILVATDSDDPRERAFRLDDDLPHVRRWARGKAEGKVAGGVTGEVEDE